MPSSVSELVWYIVCGIVGVGVPAIGWLVWSGFKHNCHELSLIKSTLQSLLTEQALLSEKLNNQKVMCAEYRHSMWETINNLKDRVDKL